MNHSPSRINTFLFFKLPAAYWCGVRARAISPTQCTTTVSYRWFTQNPFKSIYFAVLAMAAELSTGALVMLHLKASGYKISMLVAANQAQFTKKATGKITFRCEDGQQVLAAITCAIQTHEGQLCRMRAVGVDQSGEQVAVFDFDWTIKLKQVNKS